MKRRILSMLLALCMTLALLPAFSVTALAGEPVSDQVIAERIEELYQKLGGKYFNVGQNAACGIKAPGHACSNCNTANIVKAVWFKNLFGTIKTSQFVSTGSSCNGFAWFAGWYIFRANNSDTVKRDVLGEYTFSQVNISQYAHIGDFLKLTDANGNTHYAIYVSCDKNGITVLDNNGTNTKYNCVVDKHTFKYSEWKTFKITRMYSVTNGKGSGTTNPPSPPPSSDIASGTCGPNATWVLDKNGTLTVSGTGAIDNFKQQQYTPWVDYLKSIKRIIVQENITCIGEFAFSNCTEATSITLPSSLTKIDEFAFLRCKSITNISIPDSVKEIGTGAFCQCIKLKSVRIPNHVTKIGNIAFSECDALTSVNIPANVTSIGRSPFEACKNLNSITVDASNLAYCSIDGVLFSKDRKIIIQYPAGRPGTTYSIPNGVIMINESAFGNGGVGDSYCKLVNISIPSSVTSIGAWAFSGCKKLETLTIPKGVIQIRNTTFSNCDNLTSITIPTSVSAIESNAFYNCNKLEDIYYSGTEAQWKKISIDNIYQHNSVLYTATIHYSSSPSLGNYTITLKPNGGKVSPTSLKVQSGKAYFSSLPTPTRDGYEFTGWYTKASGGTKITASTKATASCTLYAHWTKEEPQENTTSTVTFNANGGQVFLRYKSVLKDAKYRDLPTPTRRGYHFAGWYTKASGGTKVTEKTRVTASKNHTLYAHWTKATMKATTKSGKWTVYIPAHYRLPLYANATTADQVNVNSAKSKEYSIQCTKMATLSNGTVRYYGKVGGVNRWFQFTCEMEID